MKLLIYGLPRWLRGKESVCNAGDTDSIPGSGRSHEEGNGNPLQYSCLGNRMDRGAWRATVHEAAKSRTPLTTKQQQKQLQHLEQCLDIKQ